MLTLTDNAIEIRNLPGSPAIPDGSGVRIATDPAGAELTLAIAELPAEDDEVLA